MRTIVKTFSAAAIAGLLAMPVMAQTNNDGVGVNAGVNAGLNFDNGIAFSLGGGVGVDTDPGSEEVPAGLGEGYVVAADTNMVGTAVMSSDGQMIGTVSNAYTAPDMQTIVRIETENEAFTDNSAIFYPLAADADVDGQLQLPMTVAELQAEFATQTGN